MPIDKDSVSTPSPINEEIALWRTDRPSVLRVATRGSALALRQVAIVSEALQRAHPRIVVQPVIVRTAGDRDQLSPIGAITDGAFVRAVEAELLSGRADAAVHSAKDIPTTEHADLSLAAFPSRGDARDAVVSRTGAPLASLPSTARVGTASPRRAALVLAARPDLEVRRIRGNVDTRLRRLDAGEFDAIVLAAAGLERLGLSWRISQYLDPLLWLPAAGQGVLAVQCRRGDPAESILAALDDPDTRAAITAERALLRRLGSGCRAPLGAYARREGGVLVLRAALIAPDGSRTVRVERRGLPEAAAALGAAAGTELLMRGAEILANC